MIVVCARCNKELGIQPSFRHPDDAETHDLCDDCARSVLALEGAPLWEYLGTFEVPVVSVSREGLITAASPSALAMLGKTPEEIQGRPGGEVFDCVHALEPEGCGNTIHCSGCTIRNAVMETYATGKPCRSVPAMLRQSTSEQPETIDLRITTQLVSVAVLLSIEWVGVPAPESNAP